MGSEIIVTPGKQSNGSAPCGTAKAKLGVCGEGWISDFDLDDDWGIIILDSNIGDSAGTFILNSPALSYLWKDVEANGYIGNIQYTSSGSISASKSKTLESLNVYVEKGLSGGPCYIRSNTGVPLVIGIISNYLSPEYNKDLHIKTIFRKIDTSLYNKLKSYCEEYAA